jgi:predicted nucleotidyltransferase
VRDDPGESSKPMIDRWGVLTSKQQEVARAFVAERELERRHLVIYLSGAHAYGFPSPDSDLDLKCVHIAPTHQLVGLETPTEPDDKIVTIDGVELDYGSNELAPVLRGVIRGNGNYLERILGELALGGDEALLSQARELTQPIVSRRAIKHYAGFAAHQLKMFRDKPSAKYALYVLRLSATARHLLSTGEIVTDVTTLPDLVPPETSELLAIKASGERELLKPDYAAAWIPRLASSVEAIEKAWTTAIVPVDPPPAAIVALDTWLREVRRAAW